MIKTTMRYDDAQEQWCIDIKGKEYSLHCGESFELFIGSKPIPCCLELASKWYIIMGNTRFDLREGDQYMVNY